MMFRPILATAGLFIATSAIVSSAIAGPARDLGASVKANVAVQVIDPAPDYTGRPATGTSGRRAADAMIRYQTGQLKPLLRTNGKADSFGQGAKGDEPTKSVPLIAGGSPN